MFLYSAVSSPSESTSLGSIQPGSNYWAETMHSHIFSTTFIARYSYMYTAKWGAGYGTKMAKFRNGSKEDSNPGSLE